MRICYYTNWTLVFKIENCRLLSFWLTLIMLEAYIITITCKMHAIVGFTITFYFTILNVIIRVKMKQKSEL